MSGAAWWVVGAAPCGDSYCARLVATTDGGESFHSFPMPEAVPAGPAKWGNQARVEEIRFADSRDGWVFGPALWATHDGGGHWRVLHLGGPVRSLVTAAGYVYAAAGNRLMRSPANTDSWSALPVPGTLGSLRSVAAYGHTVWLITSTPQNVSDQNLLLSADAGAHFGTEPPVCPQDDGAAFLDPASQSAVWAICRGGNFSELYRSTDGGHRFARAPGLSYLADATIAATSAQDAVVAELEGMYRTTDGGQHFSRVTPAPSLGETWTVIGFTSNRDGLAFSMVSTVTESGYFNLQRFQLLRTTDAGAHWRQVELPG